MKKLLATLGACAAVGLGSTAHATSGPGFSYDTYDEFVDTESCAAWGFDIYATSRLHGDVKGFFDRDGNFVQGWNHITTDFTISANGITLIEQDRWTVFFDEDGWREVGNWSHIQGPDGSIVLHDAGQLVFDADGNLVRAPGRHPQFFGAAFCDALVPTG